MKKNILVVVTLMIFGAFVANAHDLTKLRINEIMVENENSIVDEYGDHSAWLELFNANFAPLNINSIYITNDPKFKNMEPAEVVKHKGETSMYAVPVGSELTKMGKRQHIVFFLDANPDAGPFHTSLKPVPGKENWFAIYDGGGHLIDEVTVPATLKPNQSYARVEDGNDKKGFEVRTPQADDKYITPGSANKIVGENPRIQNFKEKDKNGFAMTVMAMGIVFSALLVLCLCFYVAGMIGKSSHRIKKAEAMGVDVADVDRHDHDSGEEIAAITMALHEHFNQHDNESFMLTVKKMKRAYSPWSSKIYGLREIPQKTVRRR